MPPFILETDEYIEVSVKAYYPFEKIAQGNVHLRWYAMHDDVSTPFYRDTSQYRKELKSSKNILVSNLFVKIFPGHA
jgi:hypothetical protein